MFDKIKSTVASREFQTGAGQVAIALTAIIVANVTSTLVAKGLNAGLESLMDKVHGKLIETPTVAE
jgi:hypothetical protein